MNAVAEAPTGVGVETFTSFLSQQMRVSEVRFKIFYVHFIVYLGFIEFT